VPSSGLLFGFQPSRPKSPITANRIGLSSAASAGTGGTSARVTPAAAQATPPSHAAINFHPIHAFLFIAATPLS